MKREPVSEQKLGEIVVAYLEALGADVYQEVEVADGVADIVARVGAELWIVEVKTSLSLALITQALDRRRLAHKVFVAAPYTRARGIVADMLQELGIGLLDVAPAREGVMVCGFDIGQPAVRIIVDSRRWNRRPVELAAALRPEHKTHAKAGAIGAGGRWTPFRDTCEQLARVVASKPGIPLKDAIGEIRHHYRSTSSARTSLAHWVQRGKVPGVRLEPGHPPRLHPADLNRKARP